jgi:molecular chaperone Hsp33
LVIVSSLLGSALKFDGALGIILKGNGLIDYATVDYFNDRTVRGYAKVKKDSLILESATFQELVGDGRLIITLDHGSHMGQYQGIIEIGHLSNLAECIEKYFLQSEQLPTYIRLSVATKYIKDKKSKCGGGIIIHNFVSQSTTNNYEEWSEIKYLLDTLQHHELVDSNEDINSVLFKLFHERGVRIFQEKKIQYGCKCSREKFLHYLQSFPKEEVEQMVIDNQIVIHCHFCNCEEIFIPAEI